MTKPSPRTGSRRRRFRWPAYAIFLAVIGVGIAYYRGAFDEVPTFRHETQELMTQITGGEESATIAYEGASFAFRETSLLTNFIDRTDRLTQTLGIFQQIVAVRDAERVHTVAGHAIRVDYVLRFWGHGALVSTKGNVSYLRGDDGTWRLLGFHIQIPEKLVDTMNEVNAQPERIQAPKEVISQVTSIMNALAEGDAKSVHKAASPPFQASTSLDRFESLLATYDKELGRFLRVLLVASSGQNAKKNQATVSVLLEYERARTTGVFSFIKVDESWKLLTFKVVIPEPLVPSRELDPPE